MKNPFLPVVQPEKQQQQKQNSLRADPEERKKISLGVEVMCNILPFINYN